MEEIAFLAYREYDWRFLMSSTIARNVVQESLKVKESDIVHITASRHMLDLADQIALECRKAGAETTTIFWSEPLWYWSLRELPLDWLRGMSKTDLALLDVATALVNIGGAADPKPMGKISAERWAANSEGADAFYRKFIERKARSATLAIGAVTQQRARAYGFSYPSWKRATESALKADYSKIAATGRKLRSLLEGYSAEVKVTSKSGTALNFRLGGRKCWVDDGVLDDEDLAAGTFDTTLPAGTITVAPDEDSAVGTVVSDLPIPQRGKLIKGLSWKFENGLVKEFTAAKNSEMVVPVWDKSTGDKSQFGTFGIGFNYAAKTGFLNDSIASGAVTLGIGENKVYGGRNVSTFAFQATLKKSTVVVNGQTIVSNGKLSI